MKDKDLLLRCDCSSCILAVDADWWEEDGQLFLSIYELYDCGRLRQRLRHIWHILRKGHPWTDQVMLEQPAASLLHRYLGRLLDGKAVPAGNEGGTDESQ